MGKVRKEYEMEKLKVIYEDNQIIVVEKKPNIPSQSDKTGDMDLLTMVKLYIKEKYNKPGDVYLGLVHRLDRPTGGIMVFARTSKAASRLSNSIREKEIKKTYLAVVDGIFEKTEGTLENYLYKDERHNISKVVSSDNKKAKLAKLDYKVLKVSQRNKLSLVEIDLHTGRHHQIRVQFSNIGHSLYGDQKYGIRGKRKQIALWAYKLTLKHPVTKKEMTFIDEPNWEKPGWVTFKKED